MTTVVLLRHAKAEPPDRYESDIERPLSARGRADAAAAGRWLVEEGLLPEVVLCSPAVRTRETLVALALDTPRVYFEEQLYTAGAKEVLGLLDDLDPATGTVLLIGHNPALSIVSGTLDSAASDGLSTAGLAVHEYPEGALRSTHTARG